MEISSDIRKWEASQSIFIVKGLNHVNYKPHPYTIGPRHVAEAADHHGGMLGKEVLEKMKCAYPGGCELSLKEHEYDTVLFLQLTQNVSNKEARNTLLALADIMQVEAIDGFTLIETPEKFRIDKP